MVDEGIASGILQEVPPVRFLDATTTLLYDHPRPVFPYLRQIRAVARWQPFDTSTPEGRSDERYRRIVLTTTTSMAVRAAGVVAGLITVPLLLGYLGKERYGLWTAITTVVTWATLFDFGLSNGLLNLVASAHGREDRQAARGYFSTAFLVLSLVAAMLLGVAALAIPAIPWSDLLGVQGVVDDATVRWSVAAAVAALVIGLPLATVPQLYAGYQKTYVANAFALVGSLVGLAALVVAVLLRAPMPVLVLCLSLAGVAPAALALAFARKALPWIQIRTRHVSRQALRALTERSVPIFLFQLGALAVNETQVLILARRSGLSVVADYAIALRLYLVTVSLIQLGTASFVPPIREAFERGDHAWAIRAFRHLRVLRLSFAAAGGLGLVLLGNLVLRVWLRRADVAFGWQVWGALGVLLLASVWSTVYVELLWIMDRFWPLVGLVLVNGTVTIALTWWLAPSHGVLGAVVASAAFTLLASSWIVPLLAAPLLVSRSEPG